VIDTEAFEMDEHQPSDGTGESTSAFPGGSGRVSSVDPRSSGLPVDVVDPVDLFGIGLDGGQL
jgi:hypothetical protein